MTTLIVRDGTTASAVAVESDSVRMTNKETPKRTLTKRGRKQGDRRVAGAPAPGVDLAARRQAARAAKQEFDAAHAKGMRGLRSGDMQALDKAIKDEAIAIKKLATVPLYKPTHRRRRA